MSIIKDMAKKYSVTAYEANTDSDLQDHAADELNTILKNITSKKFKDDNVMVHWLKKEVTDLIDALEDDITENPRK
jgi:hypothetical protein